MDYSLGPRVETDEHYALLRHVLGLAPEGVALEFGVGRGESTRIIAEHMPVIGFDSFQGLPEDWRDEFPKGSFAADPPYGITNCRLVVGRFEQTLWSYPLNNLPIGLVHIDCDLYSSTKTVLDYVPLTPGCVVVFDEWHGYDGCEAHEKRAWREYADRTRITWTVLGHGHEAWAIRIGAV